MTVSLRAVSSRTLSRVVVIALSLVTLMIAGCSGVDPEVLAVESRPVVESRATAASELMRGTDLRSRVREDTAGRLRESLGAFENARALGSPDAAERKEILTKAAEVCFDLATVLSDADPKGPELLPLFEKSKNYAFECLLLVPEFRALMETTKNRVDKDAVALVPKPYASVLLLMASAWGRSAQLRGTFAEMADHPKLVVLARRALELDETVQFAGPHRFFGAYYAALPGIAGGDMKKSRTHFDRAIELAPQFLDNHVMLASDWALEEGDRDLARREIEFVLSQTIADSDPLWLDQTRAQAEARKLFLRLDAGK